MCKDARVSSDFSEFEGMTFGRIVDRIASEVPEKEMLTFKGDRMTYGQFHAKVKQLAMGLKRLGIKKGDRIAALFPNGPDFFIVQQATLYIGGVFVLLSTRYREYELSYMLKHSEARCLFTVGEYLKTRFTDIIGKIRPELPNLEFCFVVGDDIPSWCRPYEEALELGKDIDEDILREDPPEYEDVASILYTSGSTGVPKGVVMTHRAFIFGAMQVARRLRITADDVTLMIVPCSHTLCAFIQFPNALMGRCRIVMMETFEAGEALGMYDQERISLIYGVPTMFILMLEHPSFSEHDFSSSRAGYTGGAIIPEELMVRIRTKMNCKIVSVYGMSENGACSMNDVEDDEALKVGTVGRPLDGVDIKIVDEQRRRVPVGEVGELAIKGPNLFQGYYKQPELTQASFDTEGYFYTGDLGKYLENGCLTIVGRKKEMIIRGGFNVYPAELEEQIRLMDGVQSVAVVGTPDKIMGEKIVACVIPVSGYKIAEQDVIRFCKNRVANYKVPNRVVIMEEFPATALGKVQKFKLLEFLENTVK
jgi:fatty-acyl-CoA synthase